MDFLNHRKYHFIFFGTGGRSIVLKIADTNIPTIDTVMIWPVIETMPYPPAASDRASLEKTRTVIDMLHRELGMRVWITLCPNVIADDQEAAKAPLT